MLQVVSLKELDCLLRWNLLYANGKNFRVDHLHPTAAESRFEHENLLGIYLTVPEFAWMAVWMAVANRAFCKKRQLNYFRPKAQIGDYVGNLGIYMNGAGELPEEALVETGYVYLFDLKSTDLIDERVDWCEGKQKLTILQGQGFESREVVLHDRRVTAWVPEHKKRMLLKLDCWQAAVVNVPRLEPTVEVELLPPLIAELRKRISLIPHEPTQDYISPSL